MKKTTALRYQDLYHIFALLLEVGFSCVCTVYKKLRVITVQKKS